MAQLRSGASAAGRGSRGPLGRWGPIAVVSLGLAAGLGFLLFTQQRQHNLAIANATADARPWELVGPACPEGFTGSWANPEYAPKKAHVFNGVRFTRRAGHVDCSAIAAGEDKPEDFVPLCQFSSPILVEVATERGVFRFQPGVGKPASISVVDGTPRCVMAANVQF